ncbi:MAG: sialate O-acetylesterase [Opitutaceae bacterium]
MPTMRVSLLLSLVLLSSQARSDVVLSALFQDHLVLQRGRPVPIWGRADPGETLTVRFHRQTVSTTAPADGRWIVYLEALEASREPAQLVVEGKNTVTVSDVVVGEVWLCSGQSNMEWPVARADRAEAEMAAAKFPLLRHFKVARTVSDLPTDALAGSWVVASPETVSGFTAVGYFFARDLHRKLGVPIGLINSSWGGTPIEAWMSPAALASDPAFAVVAERWKTALAEYPQRKAAHEKELAEWTAEWEGAKAVGKPFTRRRPVAPPGPGDPDTPSGLFNGMINPVLPFALRGTIWYQGENNVGRASEYHALFSAMITHWRAHFGQGDFPFYWVQLPNFRGSNAAGFSWALLREAQSRTLVLPETGQVVTIDIGDPDNLHPGNKQEVGRRLALIAKAQTYGFTSDYSGPVFASAEREKSALRVRFTHASNGLIARDRPLQSFEVAGADRVFHPASAAIDGETLLVSAPEVRVPVAVRYAWRNAPDANLTNGAGLPASPFRSDTW